MVFFRPEQRSIIQMMYPQTCDEYAVLLESLGNFLEIEILPTAAKTDREERFPKENLEKLFDQGLTSMAFPSRYGGLELPYPIYVAAMEMVGKACASTAVAMSIHGTVCEGIKNLGGDALKEKYLGPMIKGEKLAAFALTEPASGSDAKAMRSKAVLKNGEYHLNGSKMFITNSGQADVYFVFARTASGPSAFLVERDAEGFTFGRNIEKLGIRGSTLMELTFEDCKIPKENLVGVEGKGFEYAKQMLGGGRITIGAISVGIARIAYEKALKYSRERVQFGRPIAEFQMTQEKLANMVTQINAARLLTYYAASLKDLNRSFASEAAQAKLYSSEMALKVCDEALQIHGGYGYTNEFDVHRHWRDARLMTIGEGTSEMMRLLIAHSALKEEL